MGYENNRRTEFPSVSDLFSIRWTSALLSGVSGRGLNTGVLGDEAGEMKPGSGGVRKGKASRDTIGGEYSDNASVDRP